MLDGIGSSDERGAENRGGLHCSKVVMTEPLSAAPSGTASTYREKANASNNIHHELDHQTYI